jgi:hypothetical protein
MLTIDTGNAVSPAIEQVPDWFRDQYEIQDESRIAHDFAFHMIGEMLDENGPRKIETIRRHMTARWGFILALAEMHPDVFDELLTTYAERLQRA